MSFQPVTQRSSWYEDFTKLSDLAKAHSQEYQRAKPFPHIALDNVFSNELLDQILLEFPRVQERLWTEHTSDHSKKKLATSDISVMGEFTRNFLLACNSHAFITFL